MLALSATVQADSSSICFQVPRSFPVGGAVAIAAADFNGDGHPDVVTANNNQTVSVLLGDGKGNLGAKSDSPSGVSPTIGAAAIGVADFNADGNPDVALGGQDGIAILLGASGGTFKAPAMFSADSHIHSLALGDFNGDGFVDLAAVDDNAGKVLVFHGDGTGAFAPDSQLPTGQYPGEIAVGDLNGDGRDDVVLTDPGAGTVLSYLSLASGGFAPPKSAPAGTVPSPVALADFNGDGRLDAAVGDQFESNVEFFPGDGSGGFGARLTTPVQSLPYFLTAGDFNGDGRRDAVAAGGDLSILLGRESGGFSLPASYASNSTGAAVADFNRDGNPDLVTVAVTEVRLFLGDGKGRAAGILSVDISHSGAAVLTADLNGDGDPDLVTLGAVYLGKGNATFSAPIPFPAPGEGFSPMAVADVDGDGKLDLAIASPAYPGVAILRGLGNGAFGTPQIFPLSGNPFMPAFDDFNGDGRPDLAVATLGTVAIGFNAGGGTFTDGPLLPVPAEALAVADFNGDGKPDIVAATYGDYTFQILLGKGNGQFQAPVIFDGLPSQAFFVLAQDFNGDGHADLALACGYGNAVVIVLGDGAGGFGTPKVYTLSPGFDFTDGPYILTAGDFDGDGNLDVAAAAFTRIAILRGDGAGDFSLSEVRTLSFSVAAADFDRDGRLDIANGSQNGNSYGLMLNIRPLVVPVSLPSGTVGIPYPTTPFLAAGGVLPIPLSAIGTLPPGLQFALPPQAGHGGATLLGTPTEAGTFMFTVKAESQEGCTTSKDYAVTIAPAPAQVVLTISPNPVASGQPVVLKVTVGPTPPGGVPPTGSVTFRDGATVLGVVPLVDGVATLTVTNLGDGHHNLTAHYDGDSNFGENSSTIVVANVGVAPIPDLGIGGKLLMALVLAGIGAFLHRSG
jgi:hypothetical protein